MSDATRTGVLAFVGDAETTRKPRVAADTAAAIRRRRSRARRMRRIAGFLLLAVAPTVGAGIYLYGYASDQYVSEIRFSVRQQAPIRSEGPSMASALGGGNPLLAIVTDSETVVQYLSSRQVIDDLDGRVDMDEVYARMDADLYARMAPGLPAEKRLRYWKEMVDPYFDMTSGVVSVKVRAFRPDDARNVASVVLALSEKLVNDLSSRAHGDAVAYADKEAAAADDKLKSVEADMAAYRNRHAVLFPQMQATASSNVETSLREKLVEARATLSTLSTQGVAPDSPQARILRARASSLESEISGMQSNMTRPGEAEGSPPLASVLGGYNALETREKIQEKVLEHALSVQQDAHNAAAQQSVYLNAFVKPSLPQSSIYPVRWKELLAVALAGFVAWAISSLVVQGIRDHVD